LKQITAFSFGKLKCVSQYQCHICLSTYVPCCISDWKRNIQQIRFPAVIYLACQSGCRPLCPGRPVLMIIFVAAV